ncbi:ferritin-like domain-containing protein [Taibaiella chishuiensis]|uniref:Ferritin-like metal-binding protein YciE n=1 Tax=Taibaiella chishuiensis TaxID=1434707 RepID=A0A2P8D378_9BACT|nr:ferritin-like domain-containing protein [Taibaiella chishuiensis]PSK91680.1 ferritin-like metal-binding protein YciE [Taibaiella chishuiensis]
MKNTTGTTARTGNTQGTSNSKAAGNTNKTAKGSLLAKFFTDMLKDIYWAENHLVEKLQVMMKAATTDELQEAFEDHMHATQKHKRRLQKVFEMIGEKAEAKKCEAMDGLTKEAETIIKETEEGTMTRDAALIIAAQKIEHYEIASYGSLVQVARTLGYDRAATLLEKTLWEEEDTDQLLTDIAESDINPMADEEEEEDEAKAGKEPETSGMEA